MSTITHSEVERLVKQLPDDKLPDAYRFLSELATQKTGATTARDFMKLPLSERRRLMAEQARDMVSHYEATVEERRREWQSGDFRDVIAS